MLALLTIAAWRVTHFLQEDSLFESVREFFFWFFPPEGWYTVSSEDDGLAPATLPGAFTITRYRTEREFQLFVDDEGARFYYAKRQSKIGELFSCLWCLSIWVAAATVAIYYSIVPGISTIDQLVYWLVVASGIVVTEKLVAKL